MITIRPARPQDTPELLAMMRELARFEGYLADFRVTESDLAERAFGAQPQCHILVAQTNEGIGGYAVWLLTPFTYDLRPTVTLKELYVAPKCRGQGAAGALLTKLREEASQHNAGRIQWLVLPDNEAAKRLYRTFGGEEDHYWEHWQLSL
ncbi:MAG TPA: N-acetyltransferase [Pseudoduganella sp.]